MGSRIGDEAQPLPKCSPRNWSDAPTLQFQQSLQDCLVKEPERGTYAYVGGRWPTIPQLFVKGKLIGGADIAMELHQKGELLDILDVS